MQLDQFSAQSFEQLIQALCAHQFGAGLTVFGPGRDGGREAIFRGALPTFEAKGWNGYTVIQAKCKERPQGDARDASWLCTQLRGELQKFADNKELEAPEYYLLCSNVQLSAVPGVGGKQQVDDVFEEFKLTLGLKGWHVWSADELTALLAGAPGIRQTFASWITPGDVLFELIEKLIGPDVKKAIPLILQQELRTDRDARLRDAGQETDQAVYLEQVFIDLPVDLPIDFNFFDDLEPLFIADSDNNSDDEPLFVDTADDDYSELIEEVSFNDLTPTCVASLFNLAADRLDPKSTDTARRGKRSPFRNRVVILGGPGQGKSTLGQFVVQVARARLLSASSKLMLNPQTQRAIDAILNAAKELNIPIHGPTRMPVRVDLPSFADAIIKGSDSGASILSFIAGRFSSISGVPIGVPEVRDFLRDFPWIVIFDGLDEVPPSSNRQDVIHAIETFWDEVYNVEGDVLSIVTSRPQGYDNDFSNELWHHWHLLPLTPKYAAGYAGKLGQVRVSDPDRRASILADIDRACGDPATSLLTTSPLQVTILFGISFLKGSIPQDRWELFDRYYNLLREREAQKPGSTAKFIRDNKRIIDELHQTCGWILQAEAEARGRTVSYLSPVQFKNIISKILEDEGHEAEAISELTERLAIIATDRLVMLASRVEGQISFDVRSLQEYMAAAKIVGSDQDLMMGRLRSIAASAHWRHVFRIAASKIFSITEMGHLRSDVVSICDALDKGDIDKSAPFVGAGAALALDLLADGVGANAPKFYRSLFARAVTLLDQEEDLFDARLANVASSDKGKILLEEIEVRLNGASYISARNALTALLHLLHLDLSYIVLDKFLRSEPSKILHLLAPVDLGMLPKRYREQVKELQRIAGEATSSLFWREAAIRERENQQALTDCLFHPELLRRMPHGASVRQIHINVVGNAATNLTALDSSAELYRGVESDLDAAAWPLLNAVRNFSLQPSPETLASYIRILSKIPHEELGAIRYDLPWPLRAVNDDLRDGADIGDLLSCTESGKFGHLENWRAAEGRWRTKALEPEEFLDWNSGYYLSNHLDVSGPPPVTTISNRMPRSVASTEEFLPVIRELTDQAKRDKLLSIVVNDLRSDREAVKSGVRELLDVYFQDGWEALPLNVRRSRIFTLGPVIWTDPRIAQLANKYGLEGKRVTARASELIDIYNAQPSLRGLLGLFRGAPESDKIRRSVVEPIAEAFNYRDDDTIAVRAGVTLLRLRFNRLNEFDPERAAADLVAQPGALYEAARLLKERETRDPVRQELAYHLARQLKIAGSEPSAALFDLLKANVSATPTAMATAEMARELRLPCLTLA